MYNKCYVVIKEAGQGRYTDLVRLALLYKNDGSSEFNYYPVRNIQELPAKKPEKNRVSIIVPDEDIKKDFLSIIETIDGRKKYKQEIINAIYIDKDVVSTQMYLDNSPGVFIISDISKLSEGVTLPNNRVMAVSMQKARKE